MSAGGLSRVAGWFRLVAMAEALSWIGLLTGMYFKYLGTPRTEIGVHIFGMIHGLVFLAFLALGVLVGRPARWSVTIWAAALLASLVPLASVVFLRWAERSGALVAAQAPATA
jgi:integral membrane protein